jgi:hypothetical protein
MKTKLQKEMRTIRLQLKINTISEKRKLQLRAKLATLKREMQK